MGKNVIINGVNYDDVPEVHIPLQDLSGDAIFYDLSDADAVAANVLAGKKFYNTNGKFNGTMTAVTASDEKISTKSGVVNIQQGYHDGTGTVSISDTEKEKIISDNIRYGVSILGVAGKGTVVDTTIDSMAANGNQILSGYKAYVNGQLVTGVAQVPAVGYDTTTKILTLT